MVKCIRCGVEIDTTNPRRRYCNSCREDRAKEQISKINEARKAEYMKRNAKLLPKVNSAPDIIDGYMKVNLLAKELNKTTQQTNSMFYKRLVSTTMHRDYILSKTGTVCLYDVKYYNIKDVVADLKGRLKKPNVRLKKIYNAFIKKYECY